MDGDNKRSRYFPTVLYEIVDDPSTDSIVSWGESGKSFIVWNECEFARDFLARFFDVEDMSSFTTRLSIYGFTKVESEQWEYAKDGFVRGKPELTLSQSFVISLPAIRLRRLQREVEKQRLQLDIEKLRLQLDIEKRAFIQ